MLPPPLPDLRFSQPFLPAICIAATAKRGTQDVRPLAVDHDRQSAARRAKPVGRPRTNPLYRKSSQDPGTPVKTSRRLSEQGRSLEWSLLPDPAADDTSTTQSAARASDRQSPTADPRNFGHWADITKNAFRESTSFYFSRPPRFAPAENKKSHISRFPDRLLSDYMPSARPSRPGARTASADSFTTAPTGERAGTLAEAVGRTPGRATRKTTIAMPIVASRTTGTEAHPIDNRLNQAARDPSARSATMLALFDRARHRRTAEPERKH